MGWQLAVFAHLHSCAAQVGSGCGLPAHVAPNFHEAAEHRRSRGLATSAPAILARPPGATQYRWVAAEPCQPLPVRQAAQRGAPLALPWWPQH